MNDIITYERVLMMHELSSYFTTDASDCVW